MQPRRIRGLLLVMPAVALPLAPAFASAQPKAARAAVTRVAAVPGWRTVATIPSASILLGVTATDLKHAWAVGWRRPATNLVPLLQVWNGYKWAPVSLSHGVVASLGPAAVLDTIAAFDRFNVWAFTESGHWLHLNGVAWTAGHFASPVPTVQTALALGSTVGWALGGTAGPHGTFSPFAARITATHGWYRTRVPGKGMIVAASAATTNDIWAVIGTGALDFPATGSGLVHWTGSSWHAVVSLPAQLRNSALGAVLARSDSDVWVGGAVRNVRGGTTEAIGHWNGHSWTVVRLKAAASAARFHVTSLVTDQAGGLWALGSCTESQCGTSIASRLWHESGGRWSGPVEPVLARRAAGLVSLAVINNSVWAVGDAGVGGRRPNGLIALWGPVP